MRVVYTKRTRAVASLMRDRDKVTSRSHRRIIEHKGVQGTRPRTFEDVTIVTVITHRVYRKTLHIAVTVTCDES